MRRAFVALCLLVAGCGPRPWVAPIDVAKLPPDEQKAALAVRLFDSTLPPPATPKTIIGEVHATSCQNKVWQPPATKGNAGQQLRVKALRMGANAVVDVTYDTRGTDALGTNCWQSVTASGTAVVL